MASAAISTYRNKLDNLRSTLQRARSHAKEQAEEVTETLVETVAGAGFGALDERYGTDAIMGASVPLVVGVVATGAALLGYGGGMSGTMAAIGRAGLVCEAYRRGATMYREWDSE